MKMQVITLFLTLYLSFSNAQDIGPPSASPSVPTDKPFGPYYCQARCLASCLETYLATTLDECQKFCPPFEDNLPCPPDNADCWLTCGVPTLAADQSSPQSPALTPAISQESDQSEQDPFMIELSWSDVPNASLYIVEFYPRNRTPKPGESNFFQVMTTSLAYTVRKEDECVEYSARVIAVNSYGISAPTYTFIEAPVPTMSGSDNFAIHSLQRDPQSSDMITVTIDYNFPAGWPSEDVDIDSLRVTATDCRGPLGERTFGNVIGPSGPLNPSYDAIIGKIPTMAIQISFPDDVLQADCMFHMKVGALVTRCNTTIDYDLNPSSAPGIDFRINCDTVEGACDNDTAEAPAGPPAFAPIILPSGISIDPERIVPPLKMPGFVPPGIDQPDEIESNSTETDDSENMPTPPPLPMLVIGQSEEIQIAPLPDGASISVIDAAPNGTSAETMAIVPQSMLPPLCEMDMLDVQPTLNELSDSLVDLKVLWMERQPLPPPPPPTYFTIRYGQLIRKLVDDEPLQSEIIPGYEMIERTGQSSPEMPFLPDPTREINITSMQRGSLLKIQICAIFDPNSEPLIEWNTVPSHRIDLAALEPFLEAETSNNSPYPMGMMPMDIQDGAGAIDMTMPPAMAPVEPSMQNTISDEVVDVPLVIAVDLEQKGPSANHWLMVLAGVLLTILTALLTFVILRRLCNSRRLVKRMAAKENHLVIVNTQPPPPAPYNEVVKVPMP